jgi:predicted neuraminidase
MNASSFALIALMMGCAANQPEQKTSTQAQPSHPPGYVKSQFIVENPPFRSSHASTIVETKRGLLAAWFGGTAERNPDVGIWISRHDRRNWSAPVEVANGVQSDGKRYPCWNPVLFQPKDGPLLLFYKVGPSPSAWWGMLITSSNYGQTWSKPARLPDGQVGPVRNKPVPWRDGAILCGSSTEDNGWRIHMERTPDLGATWERTPPLNDAKEFGLIQPTVLEWPSGKTQILCRSRQGAVVESWMGADWKSWNAPARTMLPNPNSAVDAVMLRDGRGLLVYNHTTHGRSPLNVAVSSDGSLWEAALVLESEPGEYSYPAIIQSSDGLVQITYTWKRQRIKHVIVDPRKLQLRPLTVAR